MRYTQIDILNEINLAFEGVPSTFYPEGDKEDIKYSFFLDLEHGYFDTASSRIHLYADSQRWAIVFEKGGYQNRAKSIEIELNYVGNCVNFIVDKYPERNYITNTKSIELISFEELTRIENRSGSEMEKFELIDNSIEKVKVRDHIVAVDLNPNLYEKKGIELRKYDNPRKLIGFKDLIRFLAETCPEIVYAREEEIQSQLPSDLPKIMTIDNFHHLSVYDEEKSPSDIETYKLIAEVLISKNFHDWRPTLAPNNHWSNWESGHL